MRITQYTDYGLRSLIFLGIHRNKRVPMPVIAQHYGISQNYLMKVTQQLTRLGYIESRKGRNGGLQLIRNPRDINIGQVLLELEPLEIIECFEPNGYCVIEPACRLKGVLSRALRAFLQELETYTLDELIQNQDELAFYLTISPQKST